MIGALAAARAGHQADRRWAQAATGVALDLLLVAWLPLGLGAQHLAGLIVGVVLLDLGGQAVHVPQSEADFSLAAGGAQPAVWRVHAVLCGGQWIGGGAFDAGVCVGRMIKDMSSGEQPSAWRC